MQRQKGPLGVWEVKNCTSFKAMSLCKQKAKYQRENDPNEESHFEKTFNSCMFGWESDHNLLSCYKVKRGANFSLENSNEMNLGIHDGVINSIIYARHKVQVALFSMDSSGFPGKPISPHCSYFLLLRCLIKLL